MKQPANRNLAAALRAVVCGAAAALAAFVLVPLVCRGGVPDFLWIGLRVLLPLGLAAWLMRGVRPAWVWLGLPVQLVLLAAFAEPIARWNGYPLTGFMGALPYAVNMGLWALGLTAAQYVLLRLMASAQQ
ncbi:MAG: hypothetical protein IJ484_04760 [Oscillospiraceae bacterium]|nr:hypothetical protein [Oscillospiraceae bacterium]